MCKDIGADVEAAERVQVPVSFDGGNLAVVVIVGGIAGADQVRGNGVAEQDGEDAVLDRVGLVFVEGDEDEGVLHEVLVVEEGVEEGAQPFTGDGYGGVVAVRG